MESPLSSQPFRHERGTEARRKKSQRTPPSNSRLDQFENDLFGLIQKIEFKNSKKCIPGENERGHRMHKEIEEDLD